MAQNPAAPSALPHPASPCTHEVQQNVYQQDLTDMSQAHNQELQRTLQSMLVKSMVPERAVAAFLDDAHASCLLHPTVTHSDALCQHCGISHMVAQLLEDCEYARLMCVKMDARWCNLTGINCYTFHILIFCLLSPLGHKCWPP